jgi:hypothetical protein
MAVIREQVINLLRFACKAMMRVESRNQTLKDSKKDRKIRNE